jgi:hypothetical protein
MALLVDFLDFQAFFKKYLKQSPKNCLDFYLPNCDARTQSDLVGGVQDIQVFSNRLQFVGSNYNDPLVSVKFRNIVSIALFRRGKETTLLVTARPARVHYREVRGPDL